jgi:RHS repeat-associated protein
MFSAFGPWCVQTCIGAHESEGEKPHQGVASKKSALHLGQELCNSTTALGLRAVWSETRVRSRCTGKERDSESGLDMFGARYYGSSMGRFTSADSYSPQLECRTSSCFNNYVGNPQNWNRYTYTRNNPLAFVDPDGEQTELAVGGKPFPCACMLLP